MNGLEYRITIHLDIYDPEGIKPDVEIEREVLINRTRDSALLAFRNLVEILDRDMETFNEC